MSDKYILDARDNPVLEPNPTKWGHWYETANRVVACEQIGRSRISTVFTGLDYAYGKQDKPVLWETMVFGGLLNNELVRCSGTREQAQAMHARMVRRVKPL